MALNRSRSSFQRGDDSSSMSSGTDSEQEGSALPSKIELPAYLPAAWIQIESLHSSVAKKIMCNFGPLATLLYARLNLVDFIDELRQEDLDSCESFLDPILGKVQVLITKVQEEEEEESEGNSRAYTKLLHSLMALIPSPKELKVGIKHMEEKEILIYKCTLDILEAYLQEIRKDNKLYQKKLLPLQKTFYKQQTKNSIATMNK